MCKQAPEDLLDLIENTQNPTELRRLLKGICVCEDCHYGKTAETGAQDPGCCFQHRVEFRNWLMYVMNANGFREDELVSRKVKVGNEWQTRVFPIVGGRLRILHENNDQLSIQTEIVRLDSDFVVIKAAVENQRGKFNGTGTASGQRTEQLLRQAAERMEAAESALGTQFKSEGLLPDSDGSEETEG